MDITKFVGWDEAVEAWELGDGGEKAAAYLLEHGVEGRRQLEDIARMLTTKPTPKVIAKRRTLMIWRAVRMAKVMQRLDKIGRDAYSPEVRDWLLRSVYSIASDTLAQQGIRAKPEEVERYWRRCPIKDRWPTASALAQLKRQTMGVTRSPHRVTGVRPQVSAQCDSSQQSCAERREGEEPCQPTKGSTLADVASAKSKSDRRPRKAASPPASPPASRRRRST